MNGQIVEQRQRVRITWRFWVAIEGIDNFPRLRNGNISFTGIYFETDLPLGAPGAVHWLYISSTEQGEPVEVMARVIRTATIDDVRRGEVPVGVAFEFMPERAGVRDGLQALVREIGTLQLDEREAEQAETAPPLPLRPLSVQDLQIETDWELTVGETVHVDLQVRQTGRQGSFEGKVVEAVPLPEQRSRVRVQIVGEQAEATVPPPLPAEESPEEGSADRSEVVDLLFADLDTSHPPEQGEQLVGSLSRIQLSSLVSFFELERISGVLHLAREAEQAAMYFREGQLVDVEPVEEGGSIEATVARLIGWGDGTFEFVMGQVDRPDRIGVTTTALLLEVALARDTHGR